MTLLELLRLLVKRSTLNDKQKADAYVLLEHLDHYNAFSNVINQTTGEHAHDWRYVEGTTKWVAPYGYQRTPPYWMCKICPARKDSL